MIRARSLGKTWRGGTRALDDVSLGLPVGVTGLLGANGAGKTTFMQILCGLIAPTSGTVESDDGPMLEDLERHRNRIGYVPQSYGFPFGLSLVGMLLLLGRLRGVERRRLDGRIDELLERLNLVDQRKMPLSRLSGGMRQRACIAQAMVHDPGILIMDEPSVGLDPEERAGLLTLLVELGREKAILLSTHIVDDAEAACTHFAILRKGRLILSGGREAILASASGVFGEIGADDPMPPGAVPLHPVLRNGGRRLRIYARGPDAAIGGERVPPTVSDIFALSSRAGLPSGNESDAAF
jgi:ABC-2 type transport system ATP-binding protein